MKELRSTPFPQSKRNKKIIHTFDTRAHEYDAWYDDNIVFDIERSALQLLTYDLKRPCLEIGAGSGRFSQVLNIEF